MASFEEIGFSYHRDSLQSLSTVESLELSDGFPSPSMDKLALRNPCENKILFEAPNEEKSIIYASVFPRVLDIIQELQDSLAPVSIKDDCCLQSKAVFLRVPKKRNTLAN